MDIMNATQQDTPDKGKLKVNLTSQIDARPIADASVSISYTGVPDSRLEQLTTDSSGQTETIELDAPPLDLSLDPENEVQPYSEYTLQVTAPGYEPVSIAGAEILSSVTAIQNITLRKLPKKYLSSLHIHYMEPIPRKYRRTRSNLSTNQERLY